METTTLKNNTKMGTQMGSQILKHGDFSLKYFKYCDIYFLFYNDRAIWDCEFNELLDTRLIDRVFEIESDFNKAAEFIIKLYNWLDSQQEALEKLLDEIYGKKI